MTPLLCALLHGATIGLAAPQDEPRLVVLLSVDQLIPEQFERLAPELDGGLGRLWRGGLVFRSAMLGHAATETGPGHATLATGCHPRRHGVTGNSFWDRSTGTMRYCVDDQDVGPVPATAGGGKVAPTTLLMPTLSDHLRARHPESIVFSVAGKDRAAVCLGGSKPNGCVWWDKTGNGFVSSTWYGDSLPEFVSSWNGGWFAAAAGWTWSPSFDGDPTRWGTEADDRPGEGSFGGLGTTFPYVLPGADGDDPVTPAGLAPVVYLTPMIDLFTVEVARAAVPALELGADEVPDVLAIGLSGCDIVGHQYGPYSWEVTDLLFRVDAALGQLFDELDAAVGEGRWIAALSADHGVLELPESLAARGIGAQRVHPLQAGTAARAVTQALKERWPEDTPTASLAGRGFVVDVSADVDPVEARRVVADAALEAAFVAAAYTLEDLAAAPEADDDPFLALYRAGFHPERSEDVVVRPVPWTLVGVLRGTSHGSPYPYDRRVPLVFYGPGFEAARRYDPASSADAVPTLLARFGIQLQDVDGRDLLGGG